MAFIAKLLPVHGLRMFLHFVTRSTNALWKPYIEFELAQVSTRVPQLSAFALYFVALGSRQLSAAAQLLCRSCFW
jgi:hypothetical protein